MSIYTIENSSYNELVKYYDTLNNDKTTYRSSNDEPTPISCIEEMYKMIPSEFWKRHDLKVLDPCCGNGNFFIVLLNLMLKNTNYTKSQILENVFYFNDINTDRISNVMRVFCNDLYNLNIETNDYLSHSSSADDIKYDLIVANPPYAKLMDDGKRASKNHTLVRPFLTRALQQLKQGGYLLFITPDNWMSLADRNDIAEKITSLQLLYLNIHGAKKWFKKIGSSFTWYIVQNTPCYKKTFIECIWKNKVYSHHVLLKSRCFIPLLMTPNVDSILKKTILNLQWKRFQVQTSSNLHRSTKKDLLSSSSSVEFPYRIIHTPKQTLYSSRPHIYQNGYKLFISTTDKYKVFVEKDVGMTQSIAFIICKDIQEAQLFQTILEHELYVFINNICRWGNFNNIRILQRFPIPTLYENIYTSFNINKNEILYVKNNQ